MKCVHGVDMVVTCPWCGQDRKISYEADPANGLLGTANRMDVAEDRLATELASLARSIQGLSGNVAKLVEEMEPVRVSAEDSHWSDEEISSMTRNPVPPYKFNRGPEIPKEWLKTVKRGPVTDEEFWKAFQAWATGESTREILTTFAKSRGLID